MPARRIRMLAAALAAVATAAALGLVLIRGDVADAETSPKAQPVTFTPHASSLGAAGLAGLRAGFVQITIRNATKAPHGVLLLRLKQKLSNRQVVRVVSANDPNKAKPLFTHIGGIQAVPPGRSWEMTVDLSAGSYLALDFGVSGRPKLRRFQIAPSAGHHGAAPLTMGRLELHDFTFASNLPKKFSGKGVVEIPNVGKEWHEISLVRVPTGKSAKDVLRVLHSGAQAPPAGYSVHELLWVLDPGRTGFVRFDLRPGHYVALCLISEATSGKLHADLGMVTEFDVS